MFVSPVLTSSPAVERLAGRDLDHIVDAAVIKLVFLGFLAFVTFLLLLAVLIGLGFSMFSRSAGLIACILLIPFVSQVYPFPVSKSFYVGITRQPWLPAEMITFSSGQTIVGYVLSEGGSSLTFLKNDNRAVDDYPDSIVTRRQVCRIGPVRQLQPLVTVVPPATAPSSTPSCQSGPARRPATRLPALCPAMRWCQPVQQPERGPVTGGEMAPVRIRPSRENPAVTKYLLPGERQQVRCRCGHIRRC